MSRAVVIAVLAIVGLFLAAAAAVLVMWRASPTPTDVEGWALLADLPDRRGEVAATVARGLDDQEELVVMGGMTGFGRTSDAVRVYDPRNDRWHARQPLPVPRHHAAAATLPENTVIITGGAEGRSGWSPTTDVWLFDFDGWREGPALPEGRYGHAMVAIDDTAYVIGGEGGSASTLVFSFSDGTWSAGAQLPVARDHLGAAVRDGEIWAIGGRTDEVLTRVDIYDPEADSWREGPSLPAPTSGAAVVALDDTIVVVGGEDPATFGGGMVDQAWRLSADGSSWESLPPPPLAVHGAAAGVVDGQLIIGGGASRHGSWSVLSWTSVNQGLEATP